VHIRDGSGTPLFGYPRGLLGLVKSTRIENMKEKIEKTLRLTTQWLADIEQNAKKRATHHYKLATALCVVAALGAIIMIGNLVATSDEMFVLWVVTTLRLLFRGLLVVSLAIVVRFAYRIGIHAWEQADTQKQPFQK
jgi:hypothetical protein